MARNYTQNPPQYHFRCFLKRKYNNQLNPNITLYLEKCHSCTSRSSGMVTDCSVLLSAEGLGQVCFTTNSHTHTKTSTGNSKGGGKGIYFAHPVLSGKENLNITSRFIRFAALSMADYSPLIKESCLYAALCTYNFYTI